MKVALSQAARRDLREIALFIARDNKQRAQSFVRELRDKAVQIGDMPRAFPVVPYYEHHDIRRRSYRAYLIFYRIEHDRINIVRILHGARDYQTLLFAE